MKQLRRGLLVAAPALFALGIVFALAWNIRIGAIVMGAGIGVHLLSDGIESGMNEMRRRPVAVIIPLTIAVALITVALLLPRSSV